MPESNWLLQQSAINTHHNNELHFSHTQSMPEGN